MRKIYFYICRQCKEVVAVQGTANIRQLTTGLCFQCLRQSENHSQWRGDNVRYANKKNLMT